MHKTLKTKAWYLTASASPLGASPFGHLQPWRHIVHSTQSGMYASRSPVSGNFDKAPAGNSLASCACLHAACISRGKATACSNAAWADGAASNPAESCSCSTAVDPAATPAAYPAAAGVDVHLVQTIGSSAGGPMCSCVSSCRSREHAGRDNTWHGGECHAHAITTRMRLAKCSALDSQQVRTSCPSGAYVHLVSESIQTTATYALSEAF